MNDKLYKKAVVLATLLSVLSLLQHRAAGTLLPYSRDTVVHQAQALTPAPDLRGLGANPPSGQAQNSAAPPGLQNLNSGWTDTKKLSDAEMLKLLIPKMKLSTEKVESPGEQPNDENVRAPTTQASKLTKFEALNIFVPSTPDQMPRMNRIFIPEIPRDLRVPDAQSSQNGAQEAAPSAQGNFSSQPQGEIHLQTNLQLPVLESGDVASNESFPKLKPIFLTKPMIVKGNQTKNKVDLTKHDEEDEISSIEDLFDLIDTDNETKSANLMPLNNSIPSFPSLLRDVSNSSETTSFLPTPLPSSSSESLPSKSAASNKTIRENVSAIRKEYPDAVEAFSILLKNLGLSYNVANPEVDVFNPNRSTFAQTEIGAKCVTSDPKEAQGVCVPLEECPALSNLVGQTELLHSALYLYSNVCRFQGSKAYYCCPLYTFSSALPGSLLTVVSPPQASPVRAAIPGPDVCGRVRPNQAKVAGGDQAKDGEWPWLAAVGVPVSERRLRLTCTGALVTTRHVLSAAHCFYSAEIETPSHVRLADTDLNSNSVPLHQDYVIVARTFPLYHKHVSINDLVVLTLDREVVFNDLVRPACLPYDFLQSPLPGDTVTAVGFGRESARVPVSSPFPNAVELKVLENSFCQQAYYSSRNFPVLDHRTFCAGGRADMGTCEGDSGGPVHIYDARTDRYVLVGLVKGGGGCGAPDLPSVNTRLGPYLPWVETVLKRGADEPSSSH